MSPRPPSVRQSMSWLHTWAGVTLASLLFAMFWMGTLSVFDREIDRWMMPGTRLAEASANVSLDRTIVPLAAQLTQGATQWSVMMPSGRTPTMTLRYQTPPAERQVHHVDPHSGALIEDQHTLGGTGFIFPFHFSLHLHWLDLGEWLVGFAAMAMLVLLVSGVIIHRRIFQDFFSFRAHKQPARSSLDLHNLTGVVALPFHFAMTFSGLVLFFAIYFPLTWKAPYQGSRDAFMTEVYGSYKRPPQKLPGPPLASLDAMAREATQRWNGDAPYYVRVWHPGDKASYVEMRRSSAQQVTQNRDQLYFDAATGALLHSTHAPQPLASVRNFLSGLHFVQFDHWTLRFLYFAGGLTGCVMIATGLMFWLASRRAAIAAHATLGTRVIAALSVGSVTGIIIATAAFFVLNRVLPSSATALGLARERLEFVGFFLIWLTTFAHAAARPRSAWAEQAWAIAILSLLAVVANWWSTGDHLLRTIAHGQLGVAGMDACLLATALVAFAANRKLSRRFATAAEAVRSSAVAELN